MHHLKSTQDGLQKLYSTILSVFPQCKKNPVLAAPHLTLAQFETEEEFNHSFPSIKDEWCPFSFIVSEVYLLARPLKRHPFEIKHSIPVGASCKIIQGPGMYITSEFIFRTLILVSVPKTVVLEHISICSCAYSFCILQNPTTWHTWCCAAVLFKEREEMLTALENYNNAPSFPGSYARPIENLMMHLKDDSFV